MTCLGTAAASCSRGLPVVAHVHSASRTDRARTSIRRARRRGFVLELSALLAGELGGRAAGYGHEVDDLLFDGGSAVAFPLRCVVPGGDVTGFGGAGVVLVHAVDPRFAEQVSWLDRHGGFFRGQAVVGCGPRQSTDDHRGSGGACAADHRCDQFDDLVRVAVEQAQVAVADHRARPQVERSGGAGGVGGQGVAVGGVGVAVVVEQDLARLLEQIRDHLAQCSAHRRCRGHRTACRPACRVGCRSVRVGSGATTARCASPTRGCTELGFNAVTTFAQRRAVTLRA